MVRCGSKTDTKKTYLEEIGLRAQIIILRSIVDIVRVPVWAFNEHKNLYFLNNKLDIHVGSEYYEENGSGPDVNSLTSHSIS